MKQRIRLTESDLHRIVMESVNRILNENMEDEGAIGNFFNRFRRNQDPNKAAPSQGRGRYSYNPETNSYWYRDEEGNKHNTNIGYEKGRVGRNWNIFGNDYGTNVSKSDLRDARGKLTNWHQGHVKGIRQRNDIRKQYEKERAEMFKKNEADRKKMSDYINSGSGRSNEPSDYQYSTNPYFGGNPYK